MSGTNNTAAIIASHIATMIVEGANVDESKKEINSKYKEYIIDNQALRAGWQGDTAQIFVTYSNCMNKMLKAAIGTTGVLLQDIKTFSKESEKIDVQAETNAEGEK